MMQIHADLVCWRQQDARILFYSDGGETPLSHPAIDDG
jgi:hypothetical protein